MPSKLGGGLLIFALLFLAVFSWQWIEDRNVTPQAQTDPIEMVANQSDYYLEDFEILNITNAEAATPAAATGRQLKITGQSLSHHHIDGHSTIINPTVELRGANNSKWQAQAESGIVSENFDVLDLQGNVELIHNRALQSAPTTVNTDSISIDNSNQTISTDDPVQVIGAGWQYNASTMRAELNQGTLSFTSGVEAQFESPNER